MASRSANFRKMKNIRLLMINLLERMFRSASNLSDAMQSRLYNENARSRKTLGLGSYDYISMIFVLAFIFLIY